MDVKHLAKKYISEHSSPLKKPEQFGSKLFLEPLDENKGAVKEKCLCSIESILKSDRVDRRVARSVAEWLPKEKLAKVRKITKGLADFGFQNKNGKFLKPEEALYLLETNKLELINESIPMSIEEAYRNIESLDKYQVYRKLMLQGYKLKAKQCYTVTKENDEPPAKLPKLENNNWSSVFEKLREKGPQPLQPQQNHSIPDYVINAPGSQKAESLNLYVVSGNDEFKSPKSAENLNIYAICADSDTAFYKFEKINIPDLN